MNSYQTKLVFGVGPFQHSVLLEGDNSAALDDWTEDILDLYRLKVYFHGSKKWYTPYMCVERVSMLVDEGEEVVEE